MSRAEDIFEKLIYFGEDAIDEFIMSRQTEELVPLVYGKAHGCPSR